MVLSPEIGGTPAHERPCNDHRHAFPERRVKAGPDPDRGEQAGQNRREVGGDGENGNVASGHAVAPGGIRSAHGNRADDNADPAHERRVGKIAVSCAPQCGKDDEVQCKNHKRGILPVRPCSGQVGIGGPGHSPAKGQHIAPGIALHVLPYARQINTPFPPQHKHDAREADNDAGNDPPSGLLPVEQNGKQHHQAGPCVIDHAHFHRLLSSGGQIHGQTETD